MVRTDVFALVKKIKLPRAARLTVTVLSDYLTAQHTITDTQQSKTQITANDDYHTCQRSVDLGNAKITQHVLKSVNLQNVAVGYCIYNIYRTRRRTTLPYISPSITIFRGSYSIFYALSDSTALSLILCCCEKCTGCV